MTSDDVLIVDHNPYFDVITINPNAEIMNFSDFKELENDNYENESQSPNP